MDNTIENEDNENEDSNQADSESFSSSDKEPDLNKEKKKNILKQSNWDTTTKKYKADIELLVTQQNVNKEDETIEKKAVEKSPKERFVRVIKI